VNILLIDQDSGRSTNRDTTTWEMD